MKIVVALTLLGAPPAVPATAHADSVDPDQVACAGPVTTVDRAVAIMDALTDDVLPPACKTASRPRIQPDEFGNFDGPVAAIA
jgi:hypothetical protein